MATARGRRRRRAWDIMRAEQGSRLEDLFFELSHRAYRVDPAAAERVRDDFARGRISLDEALKRFKEIIGGGRRAGPRR